MNTALKNLEIKILPNSFCLQIDLTNSTNINEIVINSEVNKNVIVKLMIDNNNNSKIPPECPCLFKVKLSTNVDDFEFDVPLMINNLFVENGKMDHSTFTSFFKETNKTKQKYQFNLNKISNEDSLNKLLEKNNIFNVARNLKASPPNYYFNCNISYTIPIIFEFSYKQENKNNLHQINVNILSKIPQVSLLIKQFLDSILD